MTDTPKRWKQYLKYLETSYQAELEEWAEEHVKTEREYELRPWYMKIMHDKEQVLEWHTWEKPWKESDRFKPTLVGYFNWDVNVRKKRGKK